MNIRFEDLRHDAQLAVWDEVRSFLIWTEQIEPQRPEEGFSAFDVRLNQAVKTFIASHNYLISFDVCQTTK